MKNSHNNEFVEAEVVHTKVSRKRKIGGTVFGAAKTAAGSYAAKKGSAAAKGFAVRQAVGQVQAVKQKIILITVLYSLLIILAICAVLGLIGWALFSLLPTVIATILMTLITLPILASFYFIVNAIRLITGQKKMSHTRR